jgi:hypothetical protein
MLSDRRLQPRAVPNWPLLVYCGEYESGSLVDLCEGGLAIDGFAPGHGEDVVTIMFNLPETRAHIQAKGQIAWISDSGQRVGMRFVELAESSRQQLREWISARVAAADIRFGGVREEPSYPAAFETSSSESAAIFLQEPETAEEASRHRRAKHMIWLAIGVLSLFSGAFFLHYFLSAASDHLQLRDIRAAEKAPEIAVPSPIVPAEPQPATVPGVPPALSADVPGFVVQVGAMKQEANADTLADSLHQKNFPAFVFKRGDSPYYRVAVGVYSDADSAAKVKDRLDTQGFQTILKHWSPE